ncbi:MAG: ComEC family competence protein [Candidatus Zambryskibacteria bacterium]|nr:ComEC family competence protein [Candidatus Zambryskibacteria bacterium]
MIYSFIVSFILGLIFENYFNFGFASGILILFLVPVLFLIFSGKFFSIAVLRKSEKIILIIFLGLGLGILRFSFVNNSPDQNLLELVGQKISFEAQIVSEPDLRDNSARYTVSTDSNSKILLITDRFPKLQYGDHIEVSGELNLPKNFANDNGLDFDYVSYLAKDKIHFIIYYPEINPISSSSTGLHGTRKLVSLLYSLKNIFIENISKVVPEPNSSLLGGLIFGVKQSLGQDLLDDFREVGLIHIVVLSGYNITIIAAGIFYATGYLGKRNLGFLISAIFILLFMLMVGLGATVVRAGIMALIAILARFLGRPAAALRWLFIAGLVMLVWNPIILFYDPSFQLSFMATLGLIIFSPSIYSFISKHKIKKIIPEKFGIREIVASTIAVQFFILPILIKMVGFVSVVSFIVNPIVLPLVPWAMTLGALTGALGILPIIGGLISWPVGVLSYFLTQIIISITEFAASLPLATLQIGSISFWVIILWYAFYGLINYKIKKSNLSPSLPLH